jgi:hypothetical protein
MDGNSWLRFRFWALKRPYCDTEEMALVSQPVERPYPTDMTGKNCRR